MQAKEKQEILMSTVANLNSQEIKRKSPFGVLGGERIKKNDFKVNLFCRKILKYVEIHEPLTTRQINVSFNV